MLLLPRTTLCPPLCAG